LLATHPARRSSFATPAFLALSCVGAFAASPVFATDEPHTAPPATDDPEQSRNDVIVNGQRIKPQDDPKQVAPLVDTPKSIVVLPKSVIEQNGASNLQDALRAVPGITFGAAEGGNPIGDRPFIRGFDSQGSIYVDGVRDLASQSREVFAIDSVQIVRGSDSTLGGRGSAGGTINIISKLPQPGTFGEADASYGNGDYKRIAGDLNWQLAPTVALRIEGVWHDQDFVDRDAIWARRWGVAPSITIGLGTPTRLTASYYRLESHELPDSGIPYLYVCSTTVCNAPAGNAYSQPAIGHITLADGTSGFVPRSAFYGLKDRDFRDATTDQATLRVEHDFGGVTLRNTARFTNSRQSYIFLLPDDSNGDVFGLLNTRTGVVTPAPGTVNPKDGGKELTGGGYVWRRANTRYGYDKSIVDQIDLSGTFHTGSIEHSFAAGAEFSWEQARKGAYVLATGSGISPRCDTFTLARYYCTGLFNPNPNDPWTNYTSDTSTTQTPIVKGAPTSETQNDANTQSIYAFDSITLVPQLILNLGARWDRFQSTVTPAWVAGQVASQQFSRTDNLFNWQAGLVFKPSEDTSLYASYATAATPPNSLLGEGREDNALPTSSSTAAGSLDQLKPQKTKTYEVGAKGNILHDKLALGLAVFQTEINNARVQIDQNTVAFLGQTRIRGAELSVTGTILPGWTVFGGYTFLDTKIVDGGNAALTVAANGGAKATSVYVPSVNTGKPVPQTARNSFTMSTDYQVTKALSIGGNAIFMDRQFGGYADNRYATQDASGVITVHPATVVLYRTIPSYWTFGAHAAYAINDHVKLSVTAQNLTNTIYFSQVYASHYATIAPGRTVFGTIGVKF